MAVASIDQIVKKLLIKQPFIGTFLLGMNRHFGNKCPTACVYREGINVSMCINEEFWNSLESDEMRSAVIEHEVSHILFRHMFMSEFFSDHKHLNVASDSEVNSYIPALQKDPYVYAAKFGLEDRQGTKYYYEKIPKDNEFEQGDGTGQSFDDHGTWEDFRNLPDAERELVEHQIDYQAKEAAQQVQKMCGSIPGQFKEYIDSLFKQKPQIFNWRAYFRRMIGVVMDISLKKTYKKESLRFKGCSGIRKRKKVSIMVAIDTSGSVSSQELCDFFSEINYIHKSGAIVEIIEFDHALQKQYIYNGKWDGAIHGRGGTSFEGPLELYNKDRHKHSLLVLFTDGYAPIEDLRPQGPMVWIITSDGARQDYPGKVIYIPKNNE